MSQSLSFPMSATKMCRDLQKLDAILHADTTTTEVTFWGERRVIWRSSEDKFEKYVSLKELTEKINSIGRLREYSRSFSEKRAGERVAKKMWDFYERTDKQRDQSNFFTRILVFIRDNTSWLFIPNRSTPRSHIWPNDFWSYSDEVAYLASFRRGWGYERDKWVYGFNEKMAAEEQPVH